MRTSRKMLKDARRAVIAAFAFSGFANVLMLATPLYTLQVFETVVPLGSIETLFILTAIALMAIVTLAGIEIARDMVLLRAALWLDQELGRHALERGLKRAQPAAELARDARAVEQLKSFLASPMIVPLFDAPWVPIFVAALLALHPSIGVFAIACGAALLVAAALQLALTSRLQQDSAQAHERSEHWLTAIAANAGIAGALGLAPGATRQWDAYNRDHVTNAWSQGKRSSFVKAIGRSVRIGSQIGLYALGAWLVVRGELTPGALVASAILLARALAPIEHLVTALKPAGAALAAYRRLKAMPEERDTPLAVTPDAQSSGRIQLTDVTVYHPGRKTPALRGVSLAIAPGECVGIVGANGAGKSSLAAVVAGALTPTSGVAELDGVPVAKWQRATTLPPVGYVPDEPALIDGTVHENIARFGDTSLITAARAAMRAGVHEILHTLPGGYDCPVGPGGSALAMRERRAVAFARAFCGAPRVLVLDEPELGLDGASMRRLVSVLAQAKADGVGLLIVTQDPRLLGLTDRVVVMNAGTAQMQGSADEVLRKVDDRRVERRAQAGGQPS